MTFRLVLSFAITVPLLLNSPPGSPAALGVVTEANRAYLNRGEVSVGTTVFDGDHFFTGPRGMLSLRGDAITVELAEETSALVHSKTNEGRGTQTELTTGTLIFTATRATALEVEALEARISPLADTPTTAQISVAGRNELLVYARRGSLLFSYRKETRTILEGAAFRVVFDAPEDQPQNAGTRKAGRQSKALLFIAIGAGVTGASWAAYERHHHHKPPESPDRP